ncbi:oxidoreductases [Striga asiatica]|uniref:Oxidoreductases n=1 Tax=Striga asiatica TaxID=4170 RepID=A0A5A7RNB0_STRAF|nr:oxidoreductases [Striga asiatica]
MAPEPTSHDSTENERKSLERELKEVISALTTRLGTIQRAHKPSLGQEEEQGVGMITLAGNNVGATMQGDVDEVEQLEDLATYVNSNFQAINNSIMMGGGYKTNDPGVHLDISDVYEHNDDDDDDDQVPNKRGKKGRSKNLTRQRSKGERHNHQHGERSDETSDTNKS